MTTQIEPESHSSKPYCRAPTISRSNYAGWLRDYLGVTEQDEPALLASIPLETLGYWSAMDAQTQVTWHPVTESYASFIARHPDAEPTFFPDVV